MKQAKRFTRDQKEVLSAHYLKPDEWELYEETEFFLKIRHKETGKRKFLDKFWKGGRIR